MKVVIDIPKATYERLAKIANTGEEPLGFFERTALSGTPVLKGHWISHREHCKQLGVIPNGSGDYWWCSSCETGIESTQFHRVEYNYCPYCGAEMRTKENEVKE